MTQRATQQWAPVCSPTPVHLTWVLEQSATTHCVVGEKENLLRKSLLSWEGTGTGRPCSRTLWRLLPCSTWAAWRDCTHPSGCSTWRLGWSPILHLAKDNTEVELGQDYLGRELEKALFKSVHGESWAHLWAACACDQPEQIEQKLWEPTNSVENTQVWDWPLGSTHAGQIRIEVQSLRKRTLGHGIWI